MKTMKHVTEEVTPIRLRINGEKVFNKFIAWLFFRMFRREKRLTDYPRLKLALLFKAELENVTDVVPGYDDYEWHFKVKCTSCNEVNNNWVGVNRLDQNEIPGSRGSANLVMRCKFCKRESSAQFDTSPVTPYTIENSGKFAQMTTIECRGLEFIDFEPRATVGTDSGTKFEDIDLTDGDWAEYDEKGGIPVGISEVQAEFKRV
ncbi:9927_t:CDS:2 [Funneliformis mosseae]|uniref:9927_t:CDS:1 n=1 Tax=Funneliformis mosseae TaxID=27381 RepID=A0A9N9E5I7_FUNMO|nr:9927_t:CDS:2 [Funneliformis mosseae]